MSDAQYRLLFECNPIPMWVFDRDSLRFLAVNRAAIRQYGYSEEEFLGMTITQIRPEETVPDLMRDLSQRRSGLQEREVWKHRRKDGTPLDVEIVCHDLEFQGADAMLVAAYDVTERQQAHQAARRAEEKYRAIFDNAVVGIFQHAPDGRPLRINQAFARMHGYDSPEELLREVPNAAAQLFVTPERMMEICQTAAEQGIVRGAEVELYRKDRSRFWVMVNLRAIHDTQGALVMFEGTAEDISHRKAAEAQVSFLAYHDALTGLPNRELFKDRLENALAGARRKNQWLAVMFLDLDRFKNINDSLGHSFGDEVLKAVAGRLRQCARQQDTVARLGGDEFLIMLADLRERGEAEDVARRVVEATAQTFVVEGRALSTGGCIGISVFPEDGGDSETLIRNADAAMYCAKEEGSNRVRIFTGDMTSRATARLTVESALRAALDADEFFLLYQPQVEIASGRITGIEALLRWQHPVQGVVRPGDFIPVAESSGLILPIGEWVVRAACAQLAQWRDQRRRVTPVSVNVSALQFRQEGFCSLIRSALDDAGLPAQALELELTESLLLSSADMIQPVMEELREMGVTLAIDDFGTGYSSLSYLKQFRVRKLKIDGSFIRGLGTDRDDEAITTAVVRMAKSLNMRVVAEGVETARQAEFLRALGCDAMQGYWISHPLPAEEIAALLEAGPIGVPGLPSPACKIHAG
jgi:diguanylate cyclase (GGDEF)-like protein/PAS domain S-box-containing protein